jgi:hypothetical protein
VHFNFFVILRLQENLFKKKDFDKGSKNDICKYNKESQLFYLNTFAENKITELRIVGDHVQKAIFSIEPSGSYLQLPKLLIGTKYHLISVFKKIDNFRYTRYKSIQKRQFLYQSKGEFLKKNLLKYNSNMDSYLFRIAENTTAKNKVLIDYPF